MSKTASRRDVLIQGSAAALAASVTAGAARAATGVVIANASGSMNLTMAALMRQERFLESFGLSPEVMQVADGSKILGGVVSGSVDASMMSGFGQVFPAIEHGAPIRILAGGALTPMLALFTGKPDVRTLKDLEGKTIGTGSIGALVHQLTVTLLKKHAVDTSRVRFVNVGSNADIFRAVSAGTVDAGASEAALIADSAKHHVRMVEHGDMSLELEDYTFQGAWTSLRKIQTERDVVVRTLAAYAKLYRFVQQPGSEAAFLRARRTVFPSAPDSDHEAQWTWIQARKPFATDLVLSPERLRYMQTINVGFKVQRAVLTFDRVADMSLAADALKLLR